jgi:hypothetical protein
MKTNFYLSLAFSGTISFLTSSISAQTSQTTRAAEPKAVQIFAKAPLSFEANQGQADSRINFLSRGPGYTILLAPTEAALMLRNQKAAVPKDESEVVCMKLVGANPKSKGVPTDPIPGKINYFIGNDPKRRRKNIPTYAGVKYENVYRGVDLVYYGNQRQLEYDFIVAPGADPKSIAVKFEGAEKLQLDTQGNLIVNMCCLGKRAQGRKSRKCRRPRR